MNFKDIDSKQLEQMLQTEQKAYKKLAKKGVNVDMTRGRPCKEQLQIAMPMLENAAKCNFAMSGFDARNYGEPAGVKQARELLRKSSA